MLKGFFFTSGPTDDGDAVTGHYYELASPDPSRPQVWVYASALSYSPGETLILHAMSSAPEAALTIARDSLSPEVVLQTTLATTFAATPFDASEAGCHWPEALRLTVPNNWQSGVYTLTVTIPGHCSQGLFVLKSLKPEAKILMLLATGTWCAYNDWGGSNHYQGLTGPTSGDFAPHVSTQRPWTKGFVAWPNDAPRIPHASPLLSKPRYPHMDYARAKGISKKYASSGWAAFERPFARWCETQNIAIDYTTQHDLHRDPAALNGYDRVLIAGHDEYWTWAMRDHLEAWLDQGGQLARAARGNGCMAEYRRGRGAVFNAASCEWVAGLIARERPVEQVTRNILLGAWA